MPQASGRNSCIQGTNVRHIIIGVMAATAALFSGASAQASLIGDAVTIKRIQGGTTIFKTVNTTVGAGAEYSDNFFSIDVTENELVFDVISGNFSIGSIVYTFDGLDFDDKPGTPNIVESFSVNQISGPGITPIKQDRVTIDTSGKLTMSFANTTGSSNGSVRIRLGAPIPTAVPEPSAWALMLGGFGLLGAIARRRTGASIAFA